MSRPERPSDDLLLQLVREGRHDAEIAVRLGVTTGELRERKIDLRNRLGTQKYDELTGATTPGSRGTRKRAFLLGVAIAVGCAVLLLLVANIFAGDPDGEAAAPVRTTLGTPTARAFAEPAAAIVDGHEFEDFGEFILAGGNSNGTIGVVINRPGLSAVEMAGTSYITGSDTVAWEVVSSSRTSAFLRGTSGGRRIELALHAERPHVVFRRLGSSVGPLLEVRVPSSARVVVLIRATENQRPLQVHLTSEGRILVAKAPIDPSWVLDETTGRRIDVSGAREFGSIPINPSTSVMNVCEGAPTAQSPDVGAVICRASWRRTTRGYTVPVDGVYSCSGARSVRFEGDGIRLEFVLHGSFASAVSFACAPETVKAGDRVVPDGEWIIFAFGLDGLPTSVVVGGDGRIWVGATPGDVSCPCAPTS